MKLAHGSWARFLVTYRRQPREPASEERVVPSLHHSAERRGARAYGSTRPVMNWRRGCSKGRFRESPRDPRLSVDDGAIAAGEARTTPDTGGSK
jgi:hypothetical protein